MNLQPVHPSNNTPVPVPVQGANYEYHKKETPSGQLTPNEWLKLHSFLALTPEQQERTTIAERLEVSNLLLKRSSLSEFEYPIKPMGYYGGVQDHNERHAYNDAVGAKRETKTAALPTLEDYEARPFSTYRKRKKIELWERSSYEAVKKANKDKRAAEKKLARSTQYEHKKKLIQAFLDKNEQDVKHNGTLLFDRTRKTDEDSFKYFDKRDTQEVKLQNEGLHGYDSLLQIVWKQA